MAKAADQFRSSDVTLWGVVALACWAVAVLAASVSSLLPTDALAGLHQSRLDGATLNQVRAELVALKGEASRMRNENNVLLQRLDVSDRERTDAARRLGELEESLPALLAAVPERAAIDNAATASIARGNAFSFEAEGGSVTVEQKPLLSIRPASPVAATEAMPPEMPIPAGAFGVVLGVPLAAEDTEAQWQALTAKVGTLLIGLWPVVADAELGNGKLLVAGPVASEAQAAELCARLDRVGIQCAPAPFRGEPLPLLN